jgi:hypothetical protein
MMIRGASSKGHSAPHKLRGNSKAPFDRQLQEAEAPGASAEDLEINQEEFFACSVVRTRAIPPGHAHCFVSFALHPRICRQPPCSFCCFGESTSSFLATASASTTVATGPTARREPICSTPNGLQRTVRSSHSQQHCARVKAHLLTNILP